MEWLNRGKTQETPSLDAKLTVGKYFGGKYCELWRCGGKLCRKSATYQIIELFLREASALLRILAGDWTRPKFIRMPQFSFLLATFLYSLHFRFNSVSEPP